MVRRVASLVTLALALGAQGCFSMLMDLQGGYTSSTRFESGRQGFALNASAGGNLGDTRGAEVAGPGLAIRSKLTSEVKQISLSPHAYLLGGSGIAPYARGGVNLLQFEQVDGSFAYGMFSPYGEVGIYLSPLVLSAFAEYDLRFTSQRNEGFVGIMAGIGTGVSSRGVREGAKKLFR
ncbi:MAG TPA: hypothetical protein PLI95_08700 [Polyangiaceae bacterium]|nr:hypothetical protein [Polyangiaceae bacterium]